MNKTIFDSKNYAELFKWPEYCIFGVVVAMSMGIGIFFGFFDKKNVGTSEDFLVGGRSMSVLPVTLSLVCSFISGVAMLGDPVEVYFYGIKYVLFVASIIPMTFAVAYLYVPVFCKLKLTSAYQYLEMRYDRKVRLVVSISAIIHLILYMPLTVWAPSLALDQVAGINKYLSSAVIFLTCIAYSSLGGLKAVLWSDAFQAIIMFGSVVTILTLGVNETGGFSHVWEVSSLTGRTEFFDFDIDPRTRYTVWTGFIGSYFTWLSLFAGSQGQIQRYLSVPNVKKAQQCLLLSLCGLVMVQLPSFLLGLVMHAKYKDCDPISVDASNSDQLVPLFVMDVLGKFTGLPGILASGLTAGSLSSVSSALNAIPAIITEDFVKAYYPHQLSEKRLGYLSKIISLVAGLISFSLIFVIAAAGSIVPFSALLHGTFLGPTVGIFTLAFFFPWSNSFGAISGAVVSLCLTLFLGIGSTVNGLNGNLPDQKLPLETSGCYINESESVLLIPSSLLSHKTNQEEIPGPTSWKDEQRSPLINLFATSYIWHPFVAVCGTVIFGLIFSQTLDFYRTLIKRHKDYRHKPVKAGYMSPPLVKMWKMLLSKDKFDYWIDDDDDQEEEEKYDKSVNESGSTCRKSNASLQQ